MTFDELKNLAIKVKDARGFKPTKEVIQKYGRKLDNVAEADYDKLADELRAMLPRPKAEVDTTAKQVDALSRKTQMPPAIAAPYGKQALQVNRTIETREDAIAAVKELQEKWDLIDDVKVAETLMGKMEERHGEEFNAFFEASVRQVMLAAGLQQVKINTSDILLTLATGTQMRVREEPGFLIYEMVEDNDA
jgi:hypothetical protein